MNALATQTLNTTTTPNGAILALKTPDEIIAVITPEPKPTPTTIALKNIYSITKTDTLPYILKHMDVYEINTKPRMAAFLAACFVQSTGFRRGTERFDITPCRLYKENDRVDTPALAHRLARIGQQEVANFLHSFKDGNGGIDSNDGWNYRLRTPLQLRGRTIYQIIKDKSGIDCINEPELLETDENGIIAAMAYWQASGYNTLADKLKFKNGFELETTYHKNTGNKNYRSSRAAVSIKKKLSGNTTQLLDFCEFIERGMLYL